MKTITDLIYTMFAMGAMFLLTGAIAMFLFLSEWMNGVLQIFHQFGGDKIVQALPLNDSTVANWIMWGVALFASMSIIILLIKVVEVLQNSFWTVAACVTMFVIVMFPVYHSVALGDYKDQMEQVFHKETSALEIPDINLEFEL